MANEIIQDLSKEFTEGNEAVLMDANFRFYLQEQSIPGSNIYVERYYVSKTDYAQLATGTESTNHSNARLFDETNFRNIGGGLMTFDRYFADIPENFTEQRMVTIRCGSLFGVTFTGYNQRYIGGQLASGNQDIRNPSTGEQDTVRATVNNVTILCDVETKFVTQANLDADQDQDGVADLTIKQDSEILTMVSVTDFDSSGRFEAGTQVRQRITKYLGDIYKVQNFKLKSELQVGPNGVLANPFPTPLT